jgi:hypothetical protein
VDVSLAPDQRVQVDLVLVDEALLGMESSSRDGRAARFRCQAEGEATAPACGTRGQRRPAAARRFFEILEGGALRRRRRSEERPPPEGCRLSGGGPGVTLIAPDSFLTDNIAEELGAAGEGMRVTNLGVPPEQLHPAGKRFLRELGVAFTEALYVPEAAQAAEVLLDSIARSDGTRASVVDELFKTKVTNSLLGSFSFDRYGDIAPAPVGIYRFEGGEIVADGVIRAPLDDLGR